METMILLEKGTFARDGFQNGKMRSDVWANSLADYEAMGRASDLPQRCLIVMLRLREKAKLSAVIEERQRWRGAA